MRRIRWARSRLLRLFTYIEEPFAWLLMFVGLASFVSVLVGLVALGEAKFGTLLVAAGLFVSGFTAVQNAEDDDDDTDD